MAMTVKMLLAFGLLFIPFLGMKRFVRSGYARIHGTISRRRIILACVRCILPRATSLSSIVTAISHVTGVSTVHRYLKKDAVPSSFNDPPSYLSSPSTTPRQPAASARASACGRRLLEAERLVSLEEGAIIKESRAVT